MNKYSLKFNDLNLEQQYQNECNMNVRYPLLICILTMVSVAFIITIIMKLIQNGYYDYLLFDIGYLIFTGISTLITRKYKRVSQVFLFIFSLTSCLLFLWINIQQNSTELISLFNLIMTNVSIAFAIDFPYAAIDTTVQIGLCCFFKNIFNQTILSRDYVFSFMCLLFFNYFRYLVEVSNRTRFLLNLKDQEWSQLLQNIVKRPFILFYFDEKSFSFELRISGQLSFSCQSSQELRQFLRTAKIENLTLEQFIFRYQQSRIENQSPFVHQMIDIEFEANKYKIELSGSFVQHYSYLILFDEETLRIKSINLACSQKNKKIVAQAQESRLIQECDK